MPDHVYDDAQVCPIHPCMKLFVGTNECWVCRSHYYHPDNIVFENELCPIHPHFRVFFGTHECYECRVQRYQNIIWY